MKVDVRLISATNRDLIADVKEGRFREDLFYRLHVFPIGVPSLAERPEDIPELVRHFLARFAAEEGKRIARVDGEAMALLVGYRWPGNVRQLENAVFRAVVLAEGDEIGVAEFPQIAARSRAAGCRRAGAALGAARPAGRAIAPPLAAATMPPEPVGSHRNTLGGTLPLLDAAGRSPRARGARSRRHPLRHRALPRPDVGSRPAAPDRPLDALPQARRARVQQRVAENDTDRTPECVVAG